MTIGFIGYNNKIEKVAEQINKSSKFSLSGFYTSGNLKEVKFKALDQQEIIDQSEILFIGKEEADLNICSNAIKKSKHLFFEAPFIFTVTEFRELFELAKESDSLIHFNQYFLNDPIYNKIAKLSPDLIKCKISYSPLENKSEKQKQDIFKLTALIQNIKKTGIRKINTHPGSHLKNQYTYLSVQFDNGLLVSALINSINTENEFILHTFQQNQQYKIDLLNHEITSHKLKTKEKQTETSKKQFKHKDNLYFEEIKRFFETIRSKDDKPVTIIEESEEILELTYRIKKELEG